MPSSYRLMGYLFFKTLKVNDLDSFDLNAVPIGKCENIPYISNLMQSIV